MLEATLKLFPRNFSMVFALAGDSTMTRFSCIHLYLLKKFVQSKENGWLSSKFHVKIFAFYFIENDVIVYILVLKRLIPDLSNGRNGIFLIYLS